MHDIRTDAYARQLAEMIQWEFALIYLLVWVDLVKVFIED